jgi:thiol-disulfide isomerase/thioredoxin
MDSMNRLISGLILGIGLVSICQLANCLWADPLPAVSPADEKELKPLLDRLGALSDLIGKNSQTPGAWRYHLEQSQILFNVAARSRPEERDSWLRMAIDSSYSAAVLSPANELTAAQSLAQLPGQISRAYPGTVFVSYAALQEVQADYMRELARDGEEPAKAQERHCQRLLRYAQEFPTSADAPKVVMEAAKMSEAQGKTDITSCCYRYLIDHFPGQPMARKAEGSLWRLGQAGEVVQFELPLLYSPDDRSAPAFDLKQTSGKLVIVYFWSSAQPECVDDFPILRQLSDRYQFDGLELVYVNLDTDPAKAREFLSGRLTAGIHVQDKGGLEGAVAERYGIQALPEAFLLAPNGTLIHHSLKASQLEPEIASRLRHHR